MEHAVGKPAGAGQQAGVDADALEAIRYGWDTAHLIGYDDKRGYWAARRDRIGGLLTAANPDGLRQAITVPAGMTSDLRFQHSLVGVVCRC
jgi:hypothetical protein